MTPPIPTGEPSSFVAGDTVKWYKELPDYLPADGWTLTYYLRIEHGASGVNLVAASSGSQYLVTLSAASSNALTPGLYHYNAYAELAGERFQVSSGVLRVHPNFATIASDMDLRSDAKQALDNALDAWKRVKLGQSVTLNGRIYTQHNLDALTRYVNQCRADYQDEVRGGRMQDDRFVKVGLHRV